MGPLPVESLARELGHGCGLRPLLPSNMLLLLLLQALFKTRGVMQMPPVVEYPHELRKVCPGGRENLALAKCMRLPGIRCPESPAALTTTPPLHSTSAEHQISQEINLAEQTLR